MAENMIKVCIDQHLPEDMEDEANAWAIRENPRNRPGQARFGKIAVLTGKLWAPGRTLRARFLEGDPAIQAKVESWAHEWSKYANIQFQFGNDPGAEIRISFGHEFGDSGSWSYIGTDCLGIDPGQPTMNYGWFDANTPDDEYSRTVLHEFGHALGAIHEHQNPVAGIKWNKQAVYDWYARNTNWTKADVDHNLFDTYSADETQYTALDPASIMLYPIDRSFTLDGFSVGWNRVLSPTDIAFMADMYPYPANQEIELVVGGTAAEASIGKPDEEDLYSFAVEESGCYVVQTSGTTDTVMRLYGPDDAQKLVAMDDDGGTGRNALIRQDLQPGKYRVHVRHYLSTGTGDYQITVRREDA